MTIMAVWHDLYKARENAKNVSYEIDRLIKEHNGVGKKEISLQSEKLAEQVGESLSVIDKENKELLKNMESHRKALLAKSRFLKRHNENGFV